MASRWRFLLACAGVGLAISCVLPEQELVQPSDPEACKTCAATACQTTYDSCYGIDTEADGGTDAGADTDAGAEADAGADTTAGPCATVVDCMLACPICDSSCPNACAATSPSGMDAAMDLFECAASACPEQCGSLAN